MKWEKLNSLVGFNTAEKGKGEFVGTVVLDFQFGDVKIKNCSFVARKLARPAIMGTDKLESNGFSVHFKEGMLQVKDQKLRIYTRRQVRPVLVRAN